ncbi:hypothetical protein ALC57_05274 [Trachymyrmex cornetzi]|uniref:Uncharacterized protein n=1 Tax=Trachymyrmex cornetzi TaxID=471704 RepID=A0A151JB70_9HYME|nr:hypothetical protein ALC57_05274 [Trachymyrmex cornetzi]
MLVINESKDGCWLDVQIVQVITGTGTKPYMVPFGRLGFRDTIASFSVSFGSKSAKYGTTASCKMPKLLMIAFITYSFSSEPEMFIHAKSPFNKSAANGDISTPLTL